MKILKFHFHSIIIPFPFCKEDTENKTSGEPAGLIFLGWRWNNVQMSVHKSNKNPERKLVSFNPFMPTVPTFAVRETDVSRHNGGTSGAPLKPLRNDSALRGVRGSPIMPRDAVSRTTNVERNGGHKWVN